MKLKTKLFSLIIMFATIICILIVGVWAVKSTNFQVGGNINFAAKGINATISKGVLSSTGSFKNSGDESTKLQEIIINTSKTSSQIEKEFESWENLSLLFNDAGDDVTISFTITNNASKSDEIVGVNVTIDGGTMTNATATINTSRAYINPGDSVQFIITFKVTEKTVDASLVGFVIDFDMNLTDTIPQDQGKYPTLTFSVLDSENKTASVQGNVLNYPTGDIVIPSKVLISGVEYTVTTIKSGDSAGIKGEKGFSGYDIESITIPSSVTSIGNSAFVKCELLKSVSLSEGLKTIGSWAFRSCVALEEIVIPDSVLTIEHTAFSYCEKLTSVTIGSGVTSIGEYAFDNCILLDTVIINSVAIASRDSSIQDDLLENATKVYIKTTVYDELNGQLGTYFGVKDTDYTIVDVVLNKEEYKQVRSFDFKTIIGEMIYEIKDGVATLCSTTTKSISGSINIPSTITYENTDYQVLYIGPNAFSDCNKITDINIMPNIKNIGLQAFNGCTQLKSITLPLSLKYINLGAFNGCTSLSDVYYAGTESQWNQVYIYPDDTELTNNNCLRNATKHFSS